MTSLGGLHIIWIAQVELCASQIQWACKFTFQQDKVQSTRNKGHNRQPHAEISLLRTGDIELIL